MNILNNLLDKNGCDLPEWCHFFADTGAFLVNKEKHGERLVAATSNPTRAFAAAFLATGFVIAKAKKTKKSKNTLNDHFKFLCSQEKNTKLIFKSSKRKKIGFFDGIDWIPELQQDAVRIRLNDKNKTTDVIPRERAFEISIAPDQNVNISSRQVGYQVNINESFVEYFLKSYTKEFIAKSNLDCVIIGRLNCITNEIEDKFFNIKGENNKFVRGKLQDILRTRRLLREGESYKTDIIPTSKSKAQFGSSEVPGLVVFDSALGFLRLKDYYQNSHWVVLLDRTELSHSEGLEQLNWEFMQNRSGDVIKTEFKDVPPGVELVIYREAFK
ncbi:MAG: hypothetical protein K9L17_06800 [Clostridiales bacterium]|nr:hypothetical protein [Clostridiales bacterium]MCF8022379.1 hypothetical protein [Clostridiales bacterium]